MNWVAFAGLLIAIIGVAVRAERRMGRIESGQANNYGFIRAVARLTIKDVGTLEALQEGFMVRRSPARLNRQKLRALVEDKGHPPNYVIEHIRTIVADDAAQDEVQLIEMIHRLFTPDQLQRAAATHGGSIQAAVAVFLQVVKEAREEGVDHFLRDVGLMD